jgi:hypothetical protein
MNLSTELITVLGCATGTIISVSALASEVFRKGEPMRLANSREEAPSAGAILENADKDIEDLQLQLERLEYALGDRVQPDQIQKTKSLLNQVLQNLHRIPGRSLE